MPTYNLNEANNAPAEFAVAVTPSDVADLPDGVCRKLWVGGAGNISMIIGGATVLFSGIPAGTELRVRATRILATNTTATLIVALY